ncbi:MAG: GNAT family N-acetyltransferase [Steroidobacteraceae bacterium]|jgi:ribosomal-protein-alanine N-acetyltransferase
MNATSELRFAPARGADLPRIAALSRREIETGLLPSWTEARLDRSRRQPETMLLVAHARDLARDPLAPFEFAGFGVMAYGESRAHLNLLGVEPRLQRHGIGRQLVRWLEATALEAGTFEITLEVRASNAGAQAFYHALGYATVGRIDGYYQGRDDALRLRRDLRTHR